MKDASGPSAERRLQMIEAAISSLREVGYEGTTIREIARRGGFNSALISYHFGGLHGLLLAALDHSSAHRMNRYRQMLEEADDVPALLAAARRIYREDIEGGHITVFTEMVGASLAHPDLGPELVARAEPWLRFVEDALRKFVASEPAFAFLPIEELAYSIICFYLGVNLMTHLDEGEGRVEALFTVAERFVPMLQPLFAMLQPPK